MQVVVSEFMSQDGVVLAPGSAKEDTSSGCCHGGWSMQFFDPDVKGAVIGELAERGPATRTLRVPSVGGSLAQAGWRPVHRLDQPRPEIRGVGHLTDDDLTRTPTAIIRSASASAWRRSAASRAATSKSTAVYRSCGRCWRRQRPLRAAAPATGRPAGRVDRGQSRAHPRPSSAPRRPSGPPTALRDPSHRRADRQMRRSARLTPASAAAHPGHPGDQPRHAAGGDRRPTRP